MTARCVRLRRPATLSVVHEPFVPAGDPGLLDAVEWRWEALQRENPAYHDGRLLHVIGVHRNGYGGAVLHVADCAYRFHAVQDEDFDLGVRPLGVKGLTARDGRLLLGKRGANVAHYKGLWEFAPGGVVEPGERPETTLVRELHEETGLEAAGEPVPVAVVYDTVLRCWEMVFRVEPTSGDAQATPEYAELRWCEAGALPDGMSPISAVIAREILD
jgi:8-oxo-dGTP diphosphatase